MATAFKRGLDEVFDDLNGLLRRDESCPKAEDIRIVMLAGKSRSLDVVHQCGADSGNLVGSDANTHSGRANEESEVGLSGCHLAGHRLSVVRIVGRFRSVGPLVDHMKTHSGKDWDQAVLEGESGVV